MKIGIIGLGVVGSAIQLALKNYSDATLFTHDVKDNGSTIASVIDTDCVFVCVPTPTVDGQCDTSIVETTIGLLAEHKYQGIVIIKSTLIPGTTEKLIQSYKLRLAFVPEFLRQDYAYTDFVSKENLLIVGTHSDSDYKIICNLHKNVVSTTKKVSPTEAELAKYFCNNFSAVRIAFANIFYEVSQKLGADYNQVLDAVTAGPLHTYGHYLNCNENLRGFAGACLPKDIDAFNSFINELNLPYQLLQTTINDNEYFKK
jgi:UDPglucose 6-dehydrogenase